MKVWTYTVIFLTMMVMFQFAGFPTALEPLFNFLGLQFNQETAELTGVTIQVSDFWSYLFGFITEGDLTTGEVGGILSLIASGGITLGLVYAGKYELAIKAGFASAVLFGFITTIIFAVVHALSVGFPMWATAILGTILLPLTFGFIVALIEFVTGTD